MYKNIFTTGPVINLPVITFLLLVFFSCASKKREEIKTLPGKQPVFAEYRAIINDLDSLSSTGKVEPQTLLDAAYIAYDHNDYNSSRKFLDQYFSDHGHKPEAWYLAGCVHLNMNEPQEAVVSGLKAYSHDVNNYSLFTMLGESFFRLKNYDSANWATNIALNLYPENPEALLLKGKILIASSDTTHALEYFEKGFSLDPELNQALYSMISIYSANGNWNLEMDLIKNKLKRNNNQNLIKELVNIYINMNNFSSADSLLHIIPDKGNTFFKQISLSKLNLARYWLDSALAYADKALSTDSANREALYLKGRILEKKGRYYDARNIYAGLLIADSTDVIAGQEMDHLNRIIAYLNRLNKFRQDSIERANLKPLQTIPLRKEQ